MSWLSASNEVFGLRVVTDNRRSRLLGLILPSSVFVHFDTEATSFKQRGDRGVVFKIGARWVSPRIASTAVLLTEESTN
jgi:hypothetical protein